MAIVTYLCDVCDRKLDVPQNKIGLEVIQRCTITAGCRGKLSQIKYQQDYLRGDYPEAVDGLDDWSQRTLLYTHTQSVNRDTWNVIHNLGVFPSVQVFVEVPTAVAAEALTNLPCEQRDYRNTTTELVEVEPKDIQTVSVNEITVTFDNPQSGAVQCIARSSKPIVINQQEDIVDPGIQPFQLTNLAELSLATLNNNATISIKVKYIAPDGTETSVLYSGIDLSPAIGKSPWSAAGGGVYIDGVKYQTRSFDLTDPDTTFTIEIGSSFYIEELDGVPFDDPSLIGNELLILLASSPYAVFDKISNQFVNPFGIGAAEAVTSFYFDGNEAFAYDNLIQSVYPPIREL